ncbi:hypothetical protein VTO42DRAFT_3240 [Malbranchea cinnamomea]
MCRSSPLFCQLYRFYTSASLLASWLNSLSYFLLSALRSHNHLNSALDAHSPPLSGIPVDLDKAIDESVQQNRTIQYAQPPYQNTKINNVPPIIHRTHKTNPQYTQYFWTDESARDFIKDWFSWFLPTYDSYPFAIQRVDALRYFLLWFYGGIYLDLDILCRRPLDPLLRTHTFLHKTWPYGVSNDVMGNKPGHPLMSKLLVV